MVSAFVLTRLSRPSFPAANPSCSSFPTTEYFMRVNGRSVNGRLDESVDRCLLSPLIASLYASESGSVQRSAVVQAEYRGTSFTADVSVDVQVIDCDVIVGREWMAFFHLAGRNPPDPLIPSCSEVSSSDGLPLRGSSSAVSSTCNDDRPRSLTQEDALRLDSVRLLERGLHSVDSLSPACTIFHSEVDILRQCCSLHGVVVIDGSDYAHALLRHFFTGSCAVGLAGDDESRTASGSACTDVRRGLPCRADIISVLIGSVLHPDVRYSTDRLSMIARAVGLVSSGAKVERRRLVPMLEEFRSGCSNNQLDVAPEVLFAKFERLARGSLLALGISHGVTLSGDREAMRDSLMLHLTGGVCALHTHATHPFCKAVVRQYMPDSASCDSVSLRIHILDAVCQFIQALPLKRLLRVLNVSFDTAASLPRLRRTLRSFVDLLRRDRVRRASYEREESRLNWPALVPDHRKTDVVRAFREATASEALNIFVCASCGGKRSSGDCVEVSITDVDLNLLKRPDRRVVDGVIIDDRWIDSECIGPTLDTPFRDVDDVLLAQKGLVVSDGRASGLLLCGQCARCLRKGRTPDLALANHLFLGEVPPELQGLTVVEEAMIARCRAKSWIIQLQELAGNPAPNAQRGFRGHIIVYPQEPERVIDLLPSSILDVVTPICVIFVGSSPPSKDWLRKHARPLIVRKEKVFAALLWLRDHNPFYKDVCIDRTALESLEEEDVLPVHIEVVPPPLGIDSLTARYDDLSPVDTAVPLESNVPLDSDIFESVVVANVDPSAPSHVLRAAAMEHVMKLGKGYIQVPHGARLVGDINNPSFFPLVYPTLFPYGLGAPEDNRRARRVSLKRHVKHLLELSDPRFQTHYSFMFTAFNVLQRRSILLHSSLKIDRRLFNAFRSDFATVSPSAVRAVAERVLGGDHNFCFTAEEKRVRELLKQVSHVTSHVEGSSSARVLKRNEIRALMIEKGLPSFYVTINPADVYNPLVRLLSGHDFDIDNMLPDEVPDYWLQSILIANNPVVASRFFRLCMTAFVRTVLLYDDTRSVPSVGDPVGILGHVSAYYGCVEAQGRGSLHCHMLVWLLGSLNSDEIKVRVLEKGDLEFRDRLLAFLDDTISSSVPEDPLPHVNIPSSVHHPCSVRGPSLDGDGDSQYVLLKRKKDVHHLASACQIHKHTATCFKYWRGPPEPRECRFNLDEKNFVGRSFVDDNTGDVYLRYLDGMVNRFNETMLECVRCNMDIQFVGSGGSAKAILYYITDYITKSQLKTHVAYSALDVAVSKVGEYDPSADDLRLRAKRLLQKCAYSMISHQELSAQQVSSYLLGYGDHYTSHSYWCLYWTSFESLVEKELPSPECYRRTDVLPSAGGGVDTVTTADADEVHAVDDRNGDPPASSGETEDSPEEAVPTVDEFMIGTDADGNMFPRTNQVDDYRYRPDELGHVCLWDFCAQVDKIQKRKARGDARRDVLDAIDSGSGTDDDHELPEPVVIDLGVLDDTSYRRPCFQFLPEHVEHGTRHARVRRPQQRFVPVPIGPSLPRRDREDTMARHARLMLILFKPWRRVSDLRAACDSWAEAYIAWVGDQHGTYPGKKFLVDNVEAIQECKDARDLHMSLRRQRANARVVDGGDRVPAEIVNDGQDEERLGLDVLDNEPECNRLQFLIGLDECRSRVRLLQQNSCIDCVYHLEKSGRFNLPAVPSCIHSFAGPPRECDITGTVQSLEDEWRAAYSARVERSKQRLLADDHSAVDATRSDDAIASASIQSGLGGLPSDGFRPCDQVHPVFANLGLPVDGVHRQTLAEMIANEFGLNIEQRRAFTLVVQQAMKDRPSPLRMYIGGSGGTGKSRVIQAIQEFFKRTGQPRRFRVCSFMGVAARNVSGSTLHSALNLNERKGTKFSAKSRRDLITKWEGVDFLLVDEVSVIGQKLLVSIHEALCIAKGNDLPFGGVNIIFAGDFAQLPPVGQRALYSRPRSRNVANTSVQADVFGRLLWLSVDVVVLLTQVMRQSGDGNKRFVDLLSRLRVGKCTDEDYQLLQSRLVTNVRPSWEDGEWLSAPIIVCNNDTKDALNERAALAFAQRMGRPVHWYDCTDSVQGSTLSGIESRYLHRLHSGETNQRLGSLPLVIGMPVMITQNFDVESGIVNGCVGTLASIRYTIDDTDKRRAVSCIIHTPSTAERPLPHLDPFHSVVITDTVDVLLRHPFHGGDLKFKRTQVPILPGFAMTVHKSQGMTTDRAVVDLEGCKGTESPYVMLSRVTTLEGLLILRPFAINRITCRQTEDMRRETRRLQILDLLTLIHSSTGLQRSRAEQDLSALTGGACQALTVTSSTLTACVQRACSLVSVLDDIEQVLADSCSETAGRPDGPPRSLQRRTLKRRAVDESEDAGRPAQRTRGEYYSLSSLPSGLHDGQHAVSRQWFTRI